MTPSKNLSRRAFVRTTAVATTACAILPLLEADEPEVLGQGDYRYRVVPEWGVLTSDTPVSDCHAMVQDKRGRLLLLTNESRNNVIIYDRSGKLIGTWGHDFPGAHGLRLSDENGEEFLFITDYSRHQVFKTTMEGKILMTLDAPFESGLFVHAGPIQAHGCRGGPGWKFLCHGWLWDFTNPALQCEGGAHKDFRRARHRPGEHQ